MKIAILDDYQDTIRTLRSFPKVASHDVTIWNDHTKDVDTLAGVSRTPRCSCSSASAPRSAGR